MNHRLLLALSTAIAMTLVTDPTPAAEPSSPGSTLVYVGTYSGPKSKGIYAYRLDPASGQCTPIGLVAEVKNPSFLAVHPSKKFLYAVSEISDLDGKPTPYPNILNWISLATALHAPALAVQAGQTAKGMPVGVQIVGPWNGEDRLFDFAAAVEEGLGGFKAPPGL